MCFQIDVSDSCVTQMFLHSCVTQILTEQVHDTRFCDLEHVADTLTLLQLGNVNGVVSFC